MASGSTLRKQTAILFAVFAVIIIGVVSYNVYVNSLQPNIEVTAVNVTTIAREPTTKPVIGPIESRENGMFSHLANRTGSYSLIFSDNCSACPTLPSVGVTYSIGYSDDKTEELDIPHLGSNSIQVYLESGQIIKGTFIIYNPPFNRMSFRMVDVTGSQRLDLSFTLKNNGTANGFADISIQAEDKEVWVNRYFVQAGEQIRENTRVSFPSLEQLDFKITVVNQQRS